MPRPTSAVTVLGMNYPPEPTGISPYTGAMARGLEARGYRVSVITTHPHYPEWRVKAGYGQWSRSEHLDGVSVRRLRHYVPSSPSGIRRLLSEISFGLRLVGARWRHPRAVVAISPALFSTALAAVKARVLYRGTPFVVWVQDLYWLGMSETGQGHGHAGRVMWKVEGWLLRHAERVVVIHDRFKDRVVNDFGVDPHRVVVLRNWTHLRPRDSVDREATRARMGWGEETVVLHAGNMGVKQGLDNVLDAAQLASDRGDEVRFVLMGSGGEHARLRAEGEHIPSLQFVDPLPDEEFAAALEAADVLLVNEKVGVAEMAVPSKLTSYFSTGQPVVAATDVRGITADEIRLADAGIVVRAGDPEKLLDAVLEIARDPALAARLGSNGKRYRETVLDETFAIDQFANLLSLLIDGDARPQPNQSVDITTT